MRSSIPALHALTSDVVLADPMFVTTARDIMRDARHRVAIHLRGSHTPTRTLLERALELRVVAEDTGSWVIVHERVDVALVAGVQGAQLTSRSLTPADAHRIAPRLSLGASVHTAAEAWVQSQGEAAWLVASPAGDGSAAMREEELAAIVAASEHCPVIAIGGITLERVHGAVRAGAAGVAALRGLWLGDAVQSARRYLAAYDEGSRQ